MTLRLKKRWISLLARWLGINNNRLKCRQVSEKKQHSSLYMRSRTHSTVDLELAHSKLADLRW